MAYTAPARTATRRIRIRGTRVAGLLVAIAAIAALSAHGPASSSSTESFSSSTAPAPMHVRGRERPGPPGETGGGADGRLGAPGGTGRRAIGEADGVVPDATTVFDDGIPGVARLDSDVLRALRRAATDAADDGVQVYVDSGWRSPGYQARLLREAISQYGSAAEARRWVATPETSAHVKGDAVDIGPSDAAAWLSEHGAAYGLCRIYGNEPWHYELRPQAVAHGCPAVYADPTQDPRMRQ